jgi:hypothetical protein
MRKHELLVFGVVEAVLQDCSLTYPDLSGHFVKCLTRLNAIFEVRGLPFFTITLPDCGKWLDRCLATGHILMERPVYHGRYNKSDPRPMFLHGLWSRVFDRQGQLCADPDIHAVACLRQIYYLAKKLAINCDQDYIDAVINDYIDVERALPRSWPDTWDSDVPTWSRRTGHPLWGTGPSESARQLTLACFNRPVDDEMRVIPWRTFSGICSTLCSSWGELSVWALRPKHGPGAVSDRSPGIIKYDFKNWPRKLDGIFPHDYFASPNLDGGDNVDYSDHEYPCLMYAVPKTQKGPRLIAAEPTAHQWIQGGIQRWLEDKVSSSPLGLSIAFDDQKYSQELALHGSSDGSMATVDLSAASDRLSTRLVEYVFQGHSGLLDALHAARSRAVLIPKGLHSCKSQDELILLRKFAAMGSAVTFPVQTIVFTLIAHFATMLSDGDERTDLQSMRQRAHRIRVFGDDIIVETKVYPWLVRILETCGLKVNKEKSFSEGFFREACGMDAFMGVDVTPAYIKQAYDPSVPESLVSIVETSNNFYKRGWWIASSYLQNTVGQAELRSIPVSRKDVGPATFFTFGAYPQLPAKRRWNADTQRLEYKCLVLSSKTNTACGTGEAALIQWFTECPPTDWWRDPPTSWESGQASRPQLRKQLRWLPYFE